MARENGREGLDVLPSEDWQAALEENGAEEIGSGADDMPTRDEHQEEFEAFTRQKLLELAHIAEQQTKELEKVHIVVERTSRQITDRDGLQSVSIRQEERLQSLERRADKSEASAEKLMWWLIGTAAGLVVTVIVAILNWVIQR